MINAIYLDLKINQRLFFLKKKPPFTAVLLIIKL